MAMLDGWSLCHLGVTDEGPMTELQRVVVIHLKGSDGAGMPYRAFAKAKKGTYANWPTMYCSLERHAQLSK